MVVNVGDGACALSPWNAGQYSVVGSETSARRPAVFGDPWGHCLVLCARAEGCLAHCPRLSSRVVTSVHLSLGKAGLGLEMTHSACSLQENSSLLVFSDSKPKMLVLCPPQPPGKRVVLKGSSVRGSAPRKGRGCFSLLQRVTGFLLPC